MVGRRPLPNQIFLEIVNMALKGSHERLADRLAHILVLLNQGAKLSVRNLAERFDTSTKTALRDMARLDAIGLQQDEQGRYFLPSHLAGKLTSRDIERFAALTGVKYLFPGPGKEFLRELFDQMLAGSLLVKGHRYEDLNERHPEFERIQSAICHCKLLDFRYAKADGLKSYRDVAPYKLVNDKGIWYLAALDQDKLKTFSFSKIESLQVKAQCFQADAAVAKRIEDDESIWFGDDPQDMVLSVAAEVASYFKRRNVIANQTIVKELDDGGLIILAKVAPAHILPIVRYWIPHLRIVSPEGMQATLEQQLLAYLA
jgi:predicted DNA-binding transcriptional regulator YafY